MPSFILRNLDPEFWSRVQAKAAAEGTTVKAVILRLLASWLAAGLLLFTVGCAYQNPAAPTPPAPATPGVPARIELNSSAGTGAESGSGRISARVFDAFATALPEQTVDFRASDGTLSAAQVVTDASGMARTIITGPDGAVITIVATLGALEVTTRVAIQARPVVPPTPTPPTPTPIPPTPTPTPPTPIPPTPIPPTPIPPTPLFTRSGSGDTVFDMPTTVARVRITGTYTGTSSNFIVRIAGALVVNELLGTSWGLTSFEGTYLTSGGVVAITNSTGVAWTFTEVR